MDVGCDIHLHVEVKLGDSWFHASMSGEFSHRVYGMFAALANVRNHFRISTIPCRGIPSDASSGTLSHYLFRVTDKASAPLGVSREVAEDYVRRGICVYWLDNKNFITGPNWHSGSWCSVDELEEAYINVFQDGNALTKPQGDYADWKALLAYVKVLKESYYDVRLVYWFDN